MKKLFLFLLFIPLLSFGQNIQFGLKMVNQETDAVVDETNSIQESDTLRVELHMAAIGSDDFNALADFKYVFLDIQYNHNIVSPVTNCYAFPGIDALGDAGPIKEKYDYTNTSFGSATNHNLLEKYNEWDAGTIVYSASNAKWSVVRIAVQLSNKSLKDLLNTSYTTDTALFDMCFAVKPGASADAEQQFRINLATIEDTLGQQPTSIYADKSDGKYNFSIIEAVTYAMTLNFDLPTSLDPTNFKAQVTEVQTSVVSGVTQTNFVDFANVTLDANGDAVINGITLDKEYRVFTLQPIDGSYIPNVHTVTDAYRSFKYLTDVGINGTDYTYNSFAGFSADANLDKVLNSSDTYGLLAYVVGIDVSDGNWCLPTLDADTQTWYHGCTATVPIEDYNEDVLGAALDINTGGGGWNSAVTPTENNQTFTFGFWHHVDLDQSHSTTYPATLTAKSSRINLSAKAVGTLNFDMVSKVENGIVTVELNHSGEDIVGMQARVKYDTTRLILKDIVYDTGNEVTNFSKPFTGELLFGALSVNGKSNIKKGTPIKLVFDTVGTVVNTTGLFYFENTDAVKQNGDKLNLNIQ
jgi:hypothetical protein